MKTSYALRHQLINSLIAQRTGNHADAAIGLWEQMADQITSIVGSGGFNSLYARSVSLAQPAFPWLAAISQPPQADHRFAELRSCLEGQPPPQASAANSLLLIKFTDILSSIIGEELTINLMRASWNLDGADGDSNANPAVVHLQGAESE